MKTKYLLTAMALPLMVACTQDNVVSQQQVEGPSKELQSRIKVGKVAFTNGEETGSRFDYSTKRFEKGDKFRLFLMDEWNRCGNAFYGGEEADANETHFMEQSVWNDMYTIQNYFQTNIPFTFNGLNAWENDDVIVEGNYFAILPATGHGEKDDKGNTLDAEGNKMVTQKTILDGVRNRRDAWVYINPVQKFDMSQLDKNATSSMGVMYDGWETNQFSLGYTQIYRDEQMISEENVLQLPLQLRPILANFDMAIKNSDEMPFKVEKIVISRLDGSPMPTLAYVRPAGNTTDNFGNRQDDNNALWNQQMNVVLNNEMAQMAAGNGSYLDQFKKRYPNEDGEFELCLGHGFHGTDTEAGGYWEKTYIPQFTADRSFWANENGDYFVPDCGDHIAAPAFAQPYLKDAYTDACGNLVTDYYWTAGSWTRTAARSIVEYAYPGQYGFTPYNCTGEMAEAAYEYIIDFRNAEGEGFRLDNGQSFRACFNLPHDMNLREYTFTVYGQQLHDEFGDENWKEGIIIPKFTDNVTTVVGATTNDGNFSLVNVDPGTENTIIQASIVFDDFMVTQSRIVQTASADDLLKHLKSYYGENALYDDNKNTYFYVETMGDFEINNDLVDYVQKLYGNYSVNAGSKAMVYFVRSTGADGKGRIIFPEDLENDNAIDLFYYSKATTIVNRGVQVIDKPIIYNETNAIQTLIEGIEDAIDSKDFLNDNRNLLDKIEPALAAFGYGGVGHIINEGTLTIDGVIVETLSEAAGDGIYNAEGATLNLKNAAVVAGNELNVERNVKVHNDGTLNMTESRIAGSLYNSGKTYIKPNSLREERGESSVKVAVYNANTCVGCPTGAAWLIVEDKAIFKVPAVYNGAKVTIIDTKKIKVEMSGEGIVYIQTGGRAFFGGQNHATIQVAGQLIPDSKVALVNTRKGQIIVSDGHLKYQTGNYESADILNYGVIYVVGKSHVHINGGTGIVDTSLANQNGGYQAKSTEAGTYFRWSGAATSVNLDATISQNNLEEGLMNPIILQYPTIAFDGTEDAWQINDTNMNPAVKSEYDQKELKGYNVVKIYVKNTATVKIEGVWPFLAVVGTPAGKAGQLAGLQVEGHMYVLNGKTLTVPASNKNETLIDVSGKFRGENSSKLKGAAYVDGAGVFEFAGKTIDCEWLQGTIDSWTCE